jgi:transcriptional regulator with XRE-family HTH domain
MSGVNGHRSVLDAIAGWVRNYRQAVGLRSELANCTAEEVAQLARDVGLSAEELMSIATKGRHAADELPKLLRALGVDPQKLASDDPSTMRDLQRICIHCGHKGECRHDLAAGTAAGSYRDYCPNAMSIKALFQAK